MSKPMRLNCAMKPVLKDHWRGRPPAPHDQFSKKESCSKQQFFSPTSLWPKNLWSLKTGFTVHVSEQINRKALFVFLAYSKYKMCARWYQEMRILPLAISMLDYYTIAVFSHVNQCIPSVLNFTSFRKYFVHVQRFFCTINYCKIAILISIVKVFFEMNYLYFGTKCFIKFPIFVWLIACALMCVMVRAVQTQWGWSKIRTVSKAVLH